MSVVKEAELHRTADNLVTKLICCKGLEQAEQIFNISNKILMKHIDKRNSIIKKEAIKGSSIKCVEEQNIKKPIILQENKEMAKLSRKQICRQMIIDGKSDAEILAALSELYVADGKDQKYSDSRAKAILWSAKKEATVSKPKVEVSAKEVVETVEEEQEDEIGDDTADNTSEV